jgi:HPr Serine kinase C-terminal domain
MAVAAAKRSRRAGHVHYYRIAGLSVSSEIALPGVSMTADECGRPDVAIRRGAVPAKLDGAEVLGPRWQKTDNAFLLSIPKVARFLLRDGSEITFEAEPDADAGDIPVFLLGTAYGILLHQRERIVLHASAVRVNGRAILFCGASGAGKSTLAAALAQRGYPLITDDFCAVTITESGTPMVHPDGRQLKLWAQAIEQLDLKARSRVRVGSRIEKFYVDPGERRSETLPLGALYVLREARPPRAPDIAQPDAATAAAVLRQMAYRPGLVAHMGQRANYFHAAAAIADRAGIFDLTRALDFAAMPDVVATLERHWRDIGVTEQAA